MVVVSCIAALIVLRKLPTFSVLLSLAYVWDSAALFRDRITFECSICKSI